MPFDFSKLRGRIVEKYGTCEKFAAAMGKSKTWISTRLNNAIPWSTDEIQEVCGPQLLDIPADEIHVYFFTPKFR